MYALKALFTLLRLSSQILRFSTAVSDFRLPTIDLCEKFICEDDDRVTIWKTRFGWLPVLQDPINFKLTKTLAGMWIFSLATAFSVVEVPSLCEFSTMSSKRNHETGSCDRGTGVWKKKRCHQVGSILRPSRNPAILEPRPKYAHCTTSKADFFPRDFGARTTLHRTSYRKRAMKHTHTRTHTHTQRERECCQLLNLCYRQNGATLPPTGLRSLKKCFLNKKSIFISFLAIRRYITFI